MIKLQADNRFLLQSEKYSYMLTNYSSGITSFSILNATDIDFATNVFLLLGNFGAENAEIVKISSVNNNTGDIVITSATLFAHSESTRVTILPYDKINFYRTTTTTFSSSVSLSGTIDLQVSDWFTTYNDEVNSTGYGWYRFYNSVSLVWSRESNAIPYVGFESNTVENILSDFFSMLNNKELKLVSRDDALSWANEGYSRLRNKLNLSNVEYTVSSPIALNVVAGTVEYDLESDFDHMIAVITGLPPSNPGQWGAYKKDISFIPLREAYTFNGIGPRYYIRRFKIGILPTPGTDATYHYLYSKRPSKLTLNTDEVDLPNGGDFYIKSFMLYKAYTKFQNQSLAKQCLDDFNLGLNDLIVSSIKRDASLAAFGITRESNV